MASRLALGTVQFGAPYGIANQVGQVGRDESAAILEHAWSMGIDTLDTAAVYGDSEQRLGEFGVRRWRVVSKLAEVPADVADVPSWVSLSVTGSLERLDLTKIHGLLLHRPQQLLGPHGDALYRALVRLKDQGKVEKIGVSVYGPDELDMLWPRFQFDLVQAPFNVLDRGLATSGWLSRLHDSGVEVHVRSVFLQGLLLMAATKRPRRFDRWKPLWDQWQHWLDDHSLTPLQACLGFALSRPEIDRAVVGVDSLEQLQGILAKVESAVDEPPAMLQCQDPDLINPSRWQTS